MQTNTNKLRYETAYEQGKRDAIQGKPCLKPFGDTAKIGYSDGYHDGLVELLANTTE